MGFFGLFRDVAPPPNQMMKICIVVATQNSQSNIENENDTLQNRSFRCDLINLVWFKPPKVVLYWALKLLLMYLSKKAVFPTLLLPTTNTLYKYSVIVW